MNTPTPANNTSDAAEEDRKIDTAIAWILITGVIVSSIVVAIGGAITLSQQPNEIPNFSKFHGEPPQLRWISEICRLALMGDGKGIMQLGVLMMLLTPITRVAFSALVFLKQRDWVYVIVSLIVLAVLLFSMLVGKTGG